MQQPITTNLKIGDKVKLNDRYMNEGRRYFGNKLQYKNNFSKTIIKIDVFTQRDGQGDYIAPLITLNGKDKDGYPVQFASIFLEKIN